jgi:hemerythrin-like domain-containing protein
VPVQIGGKAESDFSSPLGLLSDCHRRIESFLNVLNRVAARAGGRPLSGEERDALEKALQYFRNSAPKHTADEENSLFPRLRALDNPIAQSSLASLTALESDHVAAAADHEVIDSLGRLWLENCILPPAEHDRLNLVLNRLSAMYERHITLEDSELFPLAEKVLRTEDLESIGREMAERRGVKR